MIGTRPRPVTFDPATPAQPPIGREVDRRVDPIVAAVLACPLVAGLHGGRYGQIATYLPGRRVTGIRITEDEVAIHLVARYPTAMDQVARQSAAQSHRSRPGWRST